MLTNNFIPLKRFNRANGQRDPPKRMLRYIILRRPKWCAQWNDNVLNREREWVLNEMPRMTERQRERGRKCTTFNHFWPLNLTTCRPNEHLDWCCTRDVNWLSPLYKTFTLILYRDCVLQHHAEEIRELFVFVDNFSTFPLSHAHFRACIEVKRFWMRSNHSANVKLFKQFYTLFEFLSVFNSFLNIFLNSFCGRSIRYWNM